MLDRLARTEASFCLTRCWLLAARCFSAEKAHLVHGPISEDGFAVNEAAHHGANLAAVIRHRTMITQDEIGIVRDHRVRVGLCVLVVRRDIRLQQLLAVYKNAPEVDPDPVAGQPDHALDEAFLRVARIMKYHDVTALNTLKMVDQLVNEDSFLVLQPRLHASALDLDWLINKQNDEQRDQNGKKQVAHPRAQRAQSGRLGGGSGSGCGI